MEEIEIKLNKIRIAVQSFIEEEQLLDAQFDIERDVCDMFRLNLRTVIYEDAESAKYQKIQYPQDWWQAFKERWYPKWLLKKYPVEYHLIIIDVRALYPKFKIVIPDHEYRLRIHRDDIYDYKNIPA